MKSFFRNLSNRFPFFVNRPSALERAVRQSPKSRRLRMEPLENRALLAVDAFGGAASLIAPDVGESWGPDPEPAAFSASVLPTDAAIVDVSAVNATLADTSFSIQVETPEPVAPPSFEQLMEALGQVKIESLDDASDAQNDAASSSFLDEATSFNTATQLLNSLNLQDISQGTPRQVVFYDSSDADFDASTLNLDDESVYYVDAAKAGDAVSYSSTSRSGGGNSGGSSNSGGSTSVVPSDYQFTTYGSTTIFESATYDSSGGSNQGPFFAFTTPASIPSGYEAFVRFEGNGAVYGHDYYVMTANIVDGVATPQHSLFYPNPNEETYDLYVSGGTSYCVIPINDNALEAAETLVATFYLVNTNSGGADYDPSPIACGNLQATIYQTPEFLTGNDANIINTDARNLGFIYDKPEVGDVVSVPGGFNLETNGRAVTYSLESSESSEYFEINSATGVISWKALPENQTYDFTLTVKATDSACAQQYDTLQLSFTYGWASFVLCVDGSDPNSGGSSSSGSSVFPGHAFWVIEATSSLKNYCRTKCNAANSITVTIDNQDYSYSFANVEDNLGCALGFYPNKDQSNLAQILLGTITGPVAGAIYSDAATLAEVDAYSIKTIPSEQNFVTALAYVERKRVDPDDYQLNVRNCIDVAHTVAQIAGVSFQTSYTELVYTPDELRDELLAPAKQNNGKQGAYTIGSSLEYNE